MSEIFFETIKSFSSEQYRLILQVATLMTTLIAIIVAKSQLEKNTKVLRLNNLKTILDLKKELHKKLNDLWKKMAEAQDIKEINELILKLDYELTNVWILAETISHFYKQEYLSKDDLQRHFKDDIKELYDYFMKFEPFNGEIPRDYPQTHEICQEWNLENKIKGFNLFKQKK